MQDQFVGTMPVQDKHRFDVASLERFMQRSVAGYAGPLQVEQFKGGQSNPTFLLRTPAQRYVLRRKPPGKLLPSAHAVDREYRVITALHGVGVPVARTYALCEDEAVIGTAFYIMEFMDGRVLWDQALPGLQPAAAPRHLRGDESRYRGAAPGRLPRRRARRLRQAGQLPGTPDRALDQAVPCLGDREDRGDGPAHRVVAAAHPERGRDLRGARGLPPRQPDLPPHRAAHPRRARLGAVHARPSARGFLLSLHVVAAAAGPVPRTGRPRSARRWASRRRRSTSRCTAAAPAVPASRTGTTTSPTTCSVWQPSVRASWGARMDGTAASQHAFEQGKRAQAAGRGWVAAGREDFVSGSIG